ncbi:MAG: hypothetical protein IRY91_13125 [Gemmatimonadaceae bacterium]|nr:hypothetical protein [Gemmatimonadaceae bacterium]
MLLPIALAVALQTGAPPQRSAHADTTPPIDTAAAARADSVRDAVHRHAHRVALTRALVASAYRDGRARSLITRARAARFRQDSSLFSYDATSKQRMTVGLSFRSAGRERMLFRSEGASRVRWQQGSGVRIDVIAARTAFPMLFPGARVLTDMFDDEAIPYFPGREGLFPLAGVRSVTQTGEGVFIHPLDHDAEAYYQYETGDSVVFRLPDGSRIRLREVKVIAREPRPDVVVGSLWFDVASAHLVRAVFRPAAPWDIVRYVKEEDSTAFDDVPRFVRPLIFPMVANVEAFTVEYGLHDQRWWLPRLQTVQGRVRAGFTHASFSLEESFRYTVVNGPDSLPPIIATAAESDSARRAAFRAHRDSIRLARRSHHGHESDDDDFRGLDCPRGDTLVETRLRYHGTLPVAIHVPCDTAALLHSPELPGSIYASGEETFDLAERDQLVKSLTLSLQPAWHPLAPTVHYGLDRGLIRYNRVEGLSLGVNVEQVFGAGLVGEATARIGTADLSPNAELEVHRSNGRRTVGLAVYRRLVSASDWGDPFSFGSSVSAFLFGRDDGSYYRSWGAELTGVRQSGAQLSWRLFAERQGNAPVETNVSLPNALHDHEFIPNVEAAPASAFGASLAFRDAYGLDPRGWRLQLDTRAEGATGTFDYARGALDATLSHSLGPRLDGALTASGGTSGGHLPPQRFWYLGGPQTVRGQDAGTRAGNAYWFGRAEVGYAVVAARPTLFFDIGWAGNRDDWAHPGRPITGAGAGASFLDGLMRFDVARGIHSDNGWRVDFYLDARF